MTLPPELLNRVNKDLKAQLDRHQAELQRLKSVTRLEQEVYQVTQQKLRDAKQQFTQIQSLNDTTATKVSEEQRASTLEGREIARLRQELETKQGRSRDLLQRVEGAERGVLDAKSKLTSAEDTTAHNEDAISKWIEENRATLSATSQASQLLAAGDTRIKNLRREVELLKLQTRQMDEATSSQTAETSDVRKAVDEAVMRKVADEREALGVRSQIADLLAREEELRVRQENHKRRQVELEDARAALNRDMERARQEFSELQSLTAKQQRDCTALDTKKNLASQALVREAAEVEEAEAQARLQEVEGSVLHGTIVKKQKELAAQRDVLRQQTLRFEKLDARRLQLEADLKANAQVTASADEEEQQTARLLRHFAAELQAVTAAEERGRRMLQDNISTHRGDCAEGDDVAQRLGVLRRALRAQHDKEAVLQDRVAKLSTVTAAIDEEIDVVKTKIAVESAKQAELGVEVRNAKRQQIEMLREELAEWDRAVRQSKAAVEQARSLLGKDHRTSQDIAGLTSEVEAEMKSLAADITRFQDELQALSADKTNAVSAAEFVYWQLEGVKGKANAQTKGLTNQLLDLGALEVQGRAEEMRLEGEQEARQLELHGQEDDRRRMHRRLQAALSQLALLRSRYTDLMSGMQRRLDQEAVDKDLDPIFEDATQNAASSSHPKALEDAFADPEEIEARHVLLRALERDKLLNYGNSLDDQIVRLEKQLAALTKASNSLRDAVQADHGLLVNATRSIRNGETMQIEGGAGDVIQGSPLLLLEGLGLDADSLRELLGDVQEEEAFLRTIRDAFEEDVQQRTRVLEGEVISWESNVHDKAAQLAEAKQTHSTWLAKLRDVTDERRQLQEVLRSLERQVHQEHCDDHRSGLSIDARHRLFRTMLDKQRVVQSTAVGLDRTRLQHLGDRLQGCVASFQRAVVRVSANERDEGCYFAFRRLCDKYGLVVSGLEGVAGGQSAQQHHPPPSQRTAPPPDAARPASRALVTAMQELRFDPTATGSGEGRLRPNSSKAGGVGSRLRSASSSLNNLSVNRATTRSSSTLMASKRTTTTTTTARK